jgi:hypothetical protein
MVGSSTLPPRPWLLKLSWALLISAAIAFSAGGRIVHELTKADRILAESVGIALALLLCLLGALARYFAEDRRAGTPDRLHGTQQQ